jgi:hypothetical protein
MKMEFIEYVPILETHNAGDRVFIRPIMDAEGINYFITPAIKYQKLSFRRRRLCRNPAKHCFYACHAGPRSGIQNGNAA